MTITYQRDENLSAAEYIAVLSRTTLSKHRPLANETRIQSMLDGANFVITARDESNRLIGLARCISDFTWVCYCAELAVHESYQGKGIGKAILATCTQLLGPRIGFILASEPEAMGFYKSIGMDPIPAFYRTNTDRS